MAEERQPTFQSFIIWRFANCNTLSNIGPPAGTPPYKWRGARRTFQVLKLVDWYHLRPVYTGDFVVIFAVIFMVIYAAIPNRACLLAAISWRFRCDLLAIFLTIFRLFSQRPSQSSCVTLTWSTTAPCLQLCCSRTPIKRPPSGKWQQAS